MSRFFLLLSLLALLFAASSADVSNETLHATPMAGSLGAVSGRQWTLITRSAPWSPRSGGVVEWYTGNTRAVGGRVVQGPMMLMYGVGVWDPQYSYEDRTDVWYSTTKGRTWAQVDQTEAQFSPLLSALTVQDSAGTQYRIQGANDMPPNAGTNLDVYTSTNGGVSWNMVGELPSGTGRFLGQAVVDSKDNIYVLMGQDEWSLLNDIWMSTTKGRTWRRINSNPSRTPPGRSVHGSVVGKFRDGADVLYIMYGYLTYSEDSRTNVYRNDVWASTTGGSSWVQLLAHAPWVARGDCQIEITTTGVIIVAGGVSSISGNDELSLNDVWASLDGGYSWGQCVADAEFSNRQFQYTVIDDEGFLYVMGGREATADHYGQVNDVWKSVYSYNDVNEVATRCGLFVPSCGVGLKCLPEDDGFAQGNWGVTCAACPFKVDMSSGSSTSSSSSNTTTIVMVVFILLFLATLAALVYTCYKMKGSGVASPIPLPQGAQRWWNGNTGTASGLDVGLNKGNTDSAADQYSQLSIRDQM